MKNGTESEQKKKQGQTLATTRQEPLKDHERHTEPALKEISDPEIVEIMSAIKKNNSKAKFMKNKFNRELFPEHVEELLQENFEIRDDKRVIEETYPTEEDRSKPDKVPSGKKIAFRNLVDMHEFESEPADNDTTLSEPLVEQVDKPATETISREAEKKGDTLVDEFKEIHLDNNNTQELGFNKDITPIKKLGTAIKEVNNINKLFSSLKNTVDPYQKIEVKHLSNEKNNSKTKFPQR